MNSKLFLSLFLFAAMATDAVAQSQPAPAQASVVESGEKYLLQPQFIPGKTYRFMSATAIQMKMADRADRTSNIKLELGAKLIVNPRPSGEPGVFITASTERIQLLLEAGQNKIDFDSAKENAMETPMGKHFHNSLTRWTQIEVSPEGKLLSRRDGGAGGAAPVMPQLPEIGPNELQQLVASLMSNFPLDPVGVGSEWIHKGETTLGQFGAMKFEIANRYLGDQLDNGAICAVVEFSGTLKGDVALQGAGGLSNKLDFEGNKMSGRFLFDKKSRITRLSEQMISMTVESPQLPKTSIDQQVQMRLISIEDTAP